MTANTLILIVYCLCGGIFLAFVWSVITKAVYGKLIDELIKNECEDLLSAKTLDELGVKKNFLLANALKKNHSLDRLLCVDNSRYYLPKEKKLKAQCLYGREKISLVSIIVTFLLFIAIVLACNYIIPNIL